MILPYFKLLVILLLLLLQAYAFIMPDGPWTLPVFPTQINVNYSEITDVPLDVLFNGKRIPRILWTSMKDNPPKSFDQMSPHYQTMHQHNAVNNWTFIFCDNNCVDNFFEKHWKGTKTYWVYKSLNRDIGVQIADLWRYCALWYYGGLYLDDDSSISKVFDSCINPEDTMIISSEKNRFDDFCYHKKYYLSIKAQRDKYPNYFPLNETIENYPHPHYHYDLLHRLIINWGIFSMPQHLILTRTIENLVHFLTLEYFHESASHITQPYALKAMTVFCATGPYMLTSSIFDVMVTVEDELTKLKLSHGNSTHKLNYLVANFTPATANETVASIEERKKIIYSVFNYTIHSHDFSDLGGKFKAVDKALNTNEYYVYRMQHQDIPLLQVFDSTTNVYNYNGLFAFLGRTLVYFMNNESNLVQHTDLVEALEDQPRFILRLPNDILHMYPMSNRSSLVMDDLPIMLKVRNERFRYFDRPYFSGFNYL